MMTPCKIMNNVQLWSKKTIIFHVLHISIAFMAEHHRMSAVVAGLASCFKQENKEC